MPARWTIYFADLSLTPCQQGEIIRTLERAGRVLVTLPSPDHPEHRRFHMATHEATIHPFPAQGRTPLTITSEEISRYAELSALVSQLEAQQKAPLAVVSEIGRAHV